MTHPFLPAEQADAVRQFRSLIAEHMGLQFDDAKLDFLGDVLQRRSKKHRVSAMTYLHALQNGALEDELSALAQELTVPETYFFRNKEQFNALTDTVLPERMRIPSHSKKLNFLSAGCASGEEAYSIAMSAKNAIADPSWTIAVDGFDLNPSALQRAESGVFSQWSLRETPEDEKEKWFKSSGVDVALAPSIRALVTFKAHNLADNAAWPVRTYDAIFCRNVMMYFTPEQAAMLICRLARALSAGGYLFLGHAETLRGLSDDFHLRHTHGTFYYQLKETVTESCAIPLRRLQPENVWLAAPATTTQRTAPAHKRSEPQADLPTKGWNREHAMTLLQQERFSDALSYLKTLATHAADNTERLLLESVLLAHSGRIDEARLTCERLIAADELNAGAYYVLALCQDHSNDCPGAIEHDRVAIHLDPAFAMPRLHLGLMARRIGDRDCARRELGHARLLLDREDSSRLLLFGGGFNRDTLIALCDSAYRDCGGVS